VTLDVDAAEAFSGAGVSVTVDLPAGEITLDPGALADLAATTDIGTTPITVSAETVPMSQLKGMQAAQVKGYQTVVEVDVYVGDTAVDVPVTISLPYTLKANEDPKAVCVWHLDDEGILTRLVGSYDSARRMITFVVTHQSKFIVGYEPVALWTNIYTDIYAADSYYEAVAFANFHGLFAGTGTGTTFSPGMGMTRGMFVTVLWALEGKPEPTSEMTGFTDVPAGAWFEKGVYWAAENGVVAGTGDGTTYSPDDIIDNQQIAVILAAYAKYKGYAIPEYREMPEYYDDALIAAWAKAQVEAMSKAGVQGLDGDDMFAPETDATRADVATALRNFLRLVVGGY
jgi:hypothetical protein